MGVVPGASPVQNSEQASRLKKVEWYAAQTLNDAVSKEKAGRYGDAVVDYLQAADLLLVLAKSCQEYTPWKTFSDKAVACQQRVRVLMAKAKLAEGGGGETGSPVQDKV